MARREGGGRRHRYVAPTGTPAASRSGRSRLLASFIGRFTTAELMPTETSPVVPALRPVGPRNANRAVGHERQLRVVRQSGEAAKRPVERRRRCDGDGWVNGKVDLGELVHCLGGDRSPGRARASITSASRWPAGPRASVGRVATRDRIEGGLPQQARRLPPAEPAGSGRAADGLLRESDEDPGQAAREPQRPVHALVSQSSPFGSRHPTSLERRCRPRREPRSASDDPPRGQPGNSAASDAWPAPEPPPLSGTPSSSSPTTSSTTASPTTSSDPPGSTPTSTPADAENRSPLLCRHIAQASWTSPQTVACSGDSRQHIYFHPLPGVFRSADAHCPGPAVSGQPPRRASGYFFTQFSGASADAELPGQPQRLA